MPRSLMPKCTLKGYKRLVPANSAHPPSSASIPNRLRNRVVSTLLSACGHIDPQLETGSLGPLGFTPTRRSLGPFPTAADKPAVRWLPAASGKESGYYLGGCLTVEVY